MSRDFRECSIAETLANREARNAYAMATGFSLDDTPAAIEKTARRARFDRRRARMSTH